MSQSSILTCLCLAASLAPFCACASAPPPKDRMAWAQSKVRESQLCGAELVPVANTELERAKGEIRRARSLSKAGNNDEAESMLRRAAADAELALALASQARSTSTE